MQNECPNCKNNKSTYIEVGSSDGYALLYHRGTGTVYPEVCLNCGVIYVNKDRLERIRQSEGFNNAE